MGFGDLINLPQVQVGNQEEARFSFLKGGYVEDFENQGSLYSLLLCQRTSLHLVMRFLLHTRVTVVHRDFVKQQAVALNPMHSDTVVQLKPKHTLNGTSIRVIFFK